MTKEYQDIKKLISLLDDEDFRDNVKGKELVKYIDDKFVVIIKRHKLNI